MRNIIVVDCISTGVNYIEDIVNRGYNPVILELQPGELDIDKYNEKMQRNYNRIEYDYDLIHEQDTYSETLELVRELDPLLVVAGSEGGVVLTTKLSNDLGLLGTPIENLEAMTLKDKMQERLKEAGLRYIRGKVVGSIDEAIEFYDAESLKEVVIKPMRSVGSVSVRICQNKNEMIDSLNELFMRTNAFGQKNTELLVQEQIKGEEFIVNTTSCKGIPRLISMWKYEKMTTSEGATIFDTCSTIQNLSLGEAEIVEYAYEVVRAIGIEYGPVHGEYMMDENGPVLIEVNCRPCGLSMETTYLDRVFGQHDTDSILDSYLYPERFEQQRKQMYRPPAQGKIKLFIAPEDILAKSTPMLNMTTNLKSYYSTTLHNINETEMFVKTEDLRTTCGVVFLVHENPNYVNEDLEFLRSVEKNAFELILSKEEYENSEIDEDEIIESMQSIINAVEKYGNGLIISDQNIGGINTLQATLNDIPKLNGHFDYIILNLNKSLINISSVEAVKLILKLTSFIKVGGVIYIPESTYNYMPGKRKGIEAITQNLNLKIEAPPFGIKDAVIASKR